MKELNREQKKTMKAQGKKLWSSKELEILKNCYPDMKISIEEVFQNLSKRTSAVIFNKATQLGLSRGGRWKKGRKPWNTGKTLPQEMKDKIRNSLKGEKCIHYGKSIPSNVRKKISKTQKLKWSNSDYAKRTIKAQQKSPNKAEIKVNDLLQEILQNEYKFVGDGEVIIQGKCPDFININEQKKIIEFFGRHWHEEDDEANRKFIFNLFGYQTLVIWEEELKNINILTNKIKEFNEK